MQLTFVHRSDDRVVQPIKPEISIHQLKTIAQLFAEALEPGPQIKAFRNDVPAAPDRKDIFDDRINAVRMLGDDVRQAPILCGYFEGLREQLAGVADCAQWIAYLVRDAGRQASQRGELQLLGALAGFRRVFEKYQRAQLAALRCAEFGKRH